MLLVSKGFEYFLLTRVEKLKNVIRKTFGKFGKLVNEHYPTDEEGKTKGTLIKEQKI